MGWWDWVQDQWDSGGHDRKGQMGEGIRGMRVVIGQVVMVFQKNIKLINFFSHLGLDVIDYGEFKYDLRKFMGLPPWVVGAARPRMSIIVWKLKKYIVISG
jgi:hypothetical protein